jgi:hypothetical protein
VALPIDEVENGFILPSVQARVLKESKEYLIFYHSFGPHRRGLPFGSHSDLFAFSATTVKD